MLRFVALALIAVSSAYASRLKIIGGKDVDRPGNFAHLDCGLLLWSFLHQKRQISIPETYCYPLYISSVFRTSFLCINFVLTLTPNTLKASESHIFSTHTVKDISIGIPWALVQYLYFILNWECQNCRDVLIFFFFWELEAIQRAIMWKWHHTPKMGNCGGIMKIMGWQKYWHLS